MVFEILHADFRLKSDKNISNLPGGKGNFRKNTMSPIGQLTFSRNNSKYPSRRLQNPDRPKPPARINSLHGMLKKYKATLYIKQ